MGGTVSKVMFPKPSPTYDADSPKLTYIPSKHSRGKSIPSLLIWNEEEGVDKVIIYFHGNGEDIGYCDYFLEPICWALKVSPF